MMTERDRNEIEATLDVLRPYGIDLRKRGYDATLWVEQRDGYVTVELRIRVPPFAIPIESVEES